ncbi:glutamine-hydrolyzing carbamoyl-phosphate synthase small subunit [Stackebrandtia nassauensis]|uniref:Carbamoyl phosphate synthase small chain n=1 Tax=Stackebrandtia nassauensis (strain DSM 44728 / CIP 108903 / NRRL B-16338 / NBRC 102104 / LLR-40K-21) TaxID=446470 RepID=D3QBE1_STANL|nr:glutamine-hydrolyzing carbamoyl-phosphate synthase small subunit [Stackebrandtia nassauensis]ADD42823.1 carbamoyl-phosphate synthase, small subunit [Stackebrandtia nassauensis DSM 44728]
MSRRAPAILVLEDGRVFHGEAFGAVGETFGEAVFATGMTGYQETLTDPSYHRQVVTMTAPHIGNTGVNETDEESPRVWVAGFVIRSAARVASNWRSQRGLEDELATQGVVGICEVDTRALTRHLRERGAMRCGISSRDTDVAALLAKVKAAPRMDGANLVDEVTCAQPYVVPANGDKKFTVAALDFGIKRNTPRRMAERGIETHVLPASSTVDDILAVKPDAVFLSNGPGDPATASGPVALVRELLSRKVPIFGICFGNQILGRALGLPTFKLKYGHRGINQPVADLETGKVEVTAHNHGFAVGLPGREHEHSAVGLPGREHEHSAVGLPGREHEHSAVGKPEGVEDRVFATDFGPAEVTHICLNDNVVEGLRLLETPAFSVQYHPEAAAGPHDADYLFDRLVRLIGEPASA